MTTTPPPVTPLSTEELARLRQWHEEDEDGNCELCWEGDHDQPERWPCTVARLLATIDSERALLDDLVLAQAAREDDDA